MNFTEINHCLTQAINNLAEGEIDVAALAMAEDLEREELEEAERTKKEQQRIDGKSMKKYGMKWRSMPGGGRLGLTRKGKVVAGPPDVLKRLPKEKLSRKAKATMGALKDAPSESGKKGAASKLRDQLAKAKKKMGKDFNAMLMQDDNLEGNLTEAWQPPKTMSYWDGQDWYFVQKLRDSNIYFRPIKKLKNGNLKGIQVTRYVGENAQKAKLTSVLSLDFNRWKPIEAKDVEKPIMRRIQEKL